MHFLADAFSNFSSQDMKETMAVAGAFGVGTIAIVTGAIKRISGTRAREQTKRELAAYVAEGSMKAEDAERILRADSPRWGGCN